MISLSQLVRFVQEGTISGFRGGELADEIAIDIDSKFSSAPDRDIWTRGGFELHFWRRRLFLIHAEFFDHALSLEAIAAAGIRGECRQYEFFPECVVMTTPSGVELFFEEDSMLSACYRHWPEYGSRAEQC